MGYENNGFFRNGFIAVILFPLMVLFASAHNSYALVATGGSGVLNLSKTEAFLNGDTIIITVIDNDLNVTSAADSGTVKITPASGSNIYLTMNENSSNSGTFLGTFKTASSTDDSALPVKVEAIANGTITVMYQDASPAADITANVSTKNYGAVIDITEDQIALGGNAVVSLYDPETNTSITTANVANINVNSITDSTGTTLRLTETGNDTGSFLGTIAVSTSDTLVNTRIKSAVDDTITVLFTDNPDADGGISTVSDTAEVVEAGTIDSSAPSGSIAINDGDIYTKTTSVTLNLSATDNTGVTGYYLSTSSTTPASSDSSWISVSSITSYSTSVSYTLSSGDGSKTVYVWYKDAAGNVSDSASASITLDATAPTVSITSPTPDATYSTTSSAIDLGGSALDSTSGVSSVAWSNSATGSSGTASGTTNWSVSNINLSEGSNSITITATDNAGNTATDSITVTYSEPQPTPSPRPIIIPPTVETDSATNVSNGSATLNGKVNANNSSTTVWFEYGTTNGVYSFLSSIQTIKGTADTSISISISDLSEGTTYYYRIAGQNSAGTSYGDEKNFTTESSCIDDFEPNDDFDVAYGPLESGKSYEGKLCSSSDRDYFKFELKNPDIQLMLTVPTDNDYDLYLYNSSKSEISNSTNPKGTETISHNNLDAGMYYIQVSGYSGSYNTEVVYVLVGTWTAATSTTPVPTSAELGAIFGSVVDTDGKPVANATVFTDKGGYSTKTGSNGTYQLNDVAEGSYLLTALAEGYGSVSQAVTVTAGETTQADFTLLRAATIPSPILSPTINPIPSTTPTPFIASKSKIFGYVMDEHNTPIESVKVICKGKNTEVKVKEYTNEEGYFEFNNLDANTYKIVAKKKGYYKSKYNVNLEEGEEKEIEMVLEEK
ncbi:MAG: hypothetical protein E3K37_02940 [Candidatus Kuenenia sp.]|nr:hypothetical protein [Candidatus Kuenenia hertensis]